MIEHDPVNHPRHYRSHPSGIETIEVTSQMGNLLGNVVKYVWRTELKAGLQDLQKGRFYLRYLIDRHPDVHYGPIPAELLRLVAQAEYHPVKRDFFRAMAENNLDEALHVIDQLIALHTPIEVSEVAS
jgi:Protein of unknwon function (DUF3310)